MLSDTLLENSFKNILWTKVMILPFYLPKITHSVQTKLQSS